MSVANRIVFLIVLKILCLVGLLLHLYTLQIDEQTHYESLSENNKTLLIKTNPPRGDIVDCSNQLLATNETTYSVIVHPSEKLKEISPQLSEIFEIDDEVITSFGSIVKENLLWNELSKLYISKIPFVHIINSKTRKYLHPHLLGHIIGYTGRLNEEELSQNTDLKGIDNQRIGKLGIEKYYDLFLRGRAGETKYEINANQKILKIINDKPPEYGKTLKLNLSLDLQTYIYEQLKEYPASCCVIMNHHTGGIVGYISKPEYDTNIFNASIPQNFYQELLKNEYKPLINRPIQALYPPASVFKMVVAIAALKQNLITPETKVFCSGFIEVPGRKAHCWRWKYGGHGSVNLEEAIKCSCDVYFYHLAKKMNPYIFEKVCNDFGFGKETGIDIYGEKKGFIGTPEWKKKVKKHAWTQGDMLNLCIGQGYILCTPIQMLYMTSMIARNGSPIRPFFSDQLEHHEIKQNYIYHKNEISPIQNGMYRAVNEIGGTIYKHKSDKVIIFGKTGTAQVKAITKEQRLTNSVNNVADRLKEHGYFVGFSQNYSVVVVGEHALWGNKVAPIGRNVLEKAEEILGKKDEKNSVIH